MPVGDGTSTEHGRALSWKLRRAVESPTQWTTVRQTTWRTRVSMECQTFWNLSVQSRKRRSTRTRREPICTPRNLFDGLGNGRDIRASGGRHALTASDAVLARQCRSAGGMAVMVRRLDRQRTRGGRTWYEAVRQTRRYGILWGRNKLTRCSLRALLPPSRAACPPL